MQTRLIYRSTLLMFLVVLMTGFNNCTNKQFSGDAPETVQGSTGNGDGYAGKMQIYNHLDPAKPCTEVQLNGKPLPNAQIFLGSGSADLVRDNCKDILAQNLPSSSYNLNTDGSLTWSGKTLEAHRPGDFEVRAAQCPAGYRPRVGAVRTNMMFDAQNLTYQDSWDVKDGGVSALLTGSFAGMPAFRVRREKDASVENWLRLSQYIDTFTPNTMYAFSFFAKKASTNRVRLQLFGGQSGSEVSGGGVWNLDTGVNEDSWEERLTQTAQASSVISDGYFITYYFRTTIPLNGLDIGFASDSPGISSSITVTGAQLEAVDSFCVPGP